MLHITQYIYRENWILKNSKMPEGKKSLLKKYERRNKTGNFEEPILFTLEELPFLIECSDMDPYDQKRGYGYFSGDAEYISK